MHLNKDAPKFKSKRLPFNLSDAVITKDADGDCHIEGYANTSSKDRVGDVVLPGAFEKTLETYLKNPVLLCNHDWSDPCGVVNEAKITDKGLWIKAKISATREDIKTLVREGCLRTFSIGYNEVVADYDEATKTKYIKELELLEISIVTVPANAEAMFSVSAAKELKIEELKNFITLVKGVVGELNGSGVEAVCSYFVENKGETMTKEQLIAELKKSAPAAAPAPTDQAKADGAAPAAEPAAAGDSMKELMAKLDMIGQALAKIMEMMPKPAEEKPKDEKPADEKPADEKPKDEPKAAPADSADDCDDDEEADMEKMSDAELDQIEAGLEKELEEADQD